MRLKVEHKKNISTRVTDLIDEMKKTGILEQDDDSAYMRISGLCMKILEDAEHIEGVKSRYYIPTINMASILSKTIEPVEVEGTVNYEDTEFGIEVKHDPSAPVIGAQVDMICLDDVPEHSERIIDSSFTKHDSMKIRMGEVVSAALKLGVDKIPSEWIDLFDDKFLLETAGVLAHGAAKYSPDNWKKCSQEEAFERYGNAAMRHAYDITQGKLVDDDSKHLHAAHIACNAMFLIYFSLRDNKYQKDGNSVNKSGCDGK